MKQEPFTQFYIKKIMKNKKSANSSKDSVSFIKNNYEKLLETIPEGELVPVIRTLYQYKELREVGIIWTDTKQKNVGRLLKDNKRHWNKLLGQSKKAVGFIEDQQFDLNEEVLRKGELVILDSDYIFLENDPHIQWGNPLATQFEERYQLEKNISKNKLK